MPITIRMHELVPAAAEGGLQAPDCSEQDVQASGLDFLDRAGVQFGQLRQAFLGHFLRHSQPTDIGTEDTEPKELLVCHTTLPCMAGLTNTAQWGAL